MGATDKRLFGPALLTNVTGTKYTAPALTKTQVRHIHFNNGDTVPRTVTLSVGADAAGTRLFDAMSIAAKTPYDWYPDRLFLDPAEFIAANADVTNVVTLEMNGTENVL